MGLNFAAKYTTNECVYPFRINQLKTRAMKNTYLLLSLASMLLLTQCSKNDAGSNINANANNLSVGASAQDFLTASKFSSINMEINYMPGYAPNAAALDNLIAFLNTLINKPGGINVTQRQIAASGKTILTLDDIKSMEFTNRTIFNSGTTLGVYVLFADADYDQANVLGVAYKNTSLVVFGKTVHNNSGGINQASLTKLESTVEEHEFGHLLGLVNTGTPMQVNHEDAAHAKHCSNSACLMYYATQVNMMGGILVSGPVPVLDANCKNDLTANGGK